MGRLIGAVSFFPKQPKCVHNSDQKTSKERQSQAVVWASCLWVLFGLTSSVRCVWGCFCGVVEGGAWTSRERPVSELSASKGIALPLTHHHATHMPYWIHTPLHTLTLSPFLVPRWRPSLGSATGKPSTRQYLLLPRPPHPTPQLRYNARRGPCHHHQHQPGAPPKGAGRRGSTPGLVPRARPCGAGPGACLSD